MSHIFRNFLNVLRHYKTASILNIIGLSAAFAAFLILMLKVSYELSYDKFHPDSERLFKLELYSQDLGSSFNILPRGTVNEFIRSSTHIEAGAAIMPSWFGEIYFTYMRNGQKTGFLNNVSQVDPAFVKSMMGFTMLEGTADCLESPGTILIPESMAKRMDNAPLLGKTLTCDDNVWGNFDGPKDLIIGGVYKDFPSNSMFENNCYLSLLPNFQIASFNAANFECYIKLDDPAYATEVCEQFVRNFKEESWQKPTAATLTVLSDLYLNNPQTKNRVRLLIFISLLIIVVAAINFTNFSTSLAPVRMKSLNTMKVMGAGIGELRMSLLCEGIFVTLLSFGIGLLLVLAAEQSHLLTTFIGNIHLSYNVWPLALTALLAVLIGFISGLWPTFYMTSLPPALVLKGSFGLSPKGRRFRTLLVGLQFVVSFSLIIASFCMDRQNHYMLTQDIGFNDNDVAVVQLSKAHNERREYFVNTLRNNAMVTDVAFSSARIGAGDLYTVEGFTYNGQTSDKTFVLRVSSNFFSMMEIPLLEGRWATESEEQLSPGVVFFNRFCRDAMNILPSTDIGYPHGKTVAGIVEDVHVTSLRQPVCNTMYIVTDNLPIAYVKCTPGTSQREATHLINDVLKEIDPAYPATVSFYSDLIAQLYSTETAFGRVIRIFSILAILISIMGVFGMVVFETQYRQKEIGVRKIMGSTIAEILFMFNRKYVVLTAVCCLIASPIAYFLIQRWLGSFAYHVTIPWWIFPVAFLVIAFITLLTVTLQSWRSAEANPVDSLKSE